LRHTFFDVMPEFLAKLGRGFGRRLALRIERLAIEPLCREGDAQLLQLPFDGGKIRARRRRNGVGITDLGTGGGIECGRGVAHAAAYHMLGDETATEVAPRLPPVKPANFVRNGAIAGVTALGGSAVSKEARGHTAKPVMPCSDYRAPRGAG
jgi:hypothetical protein